MLKNRVLTGLILAGLVAFGIFTASRSVFAWVSAGMFLFATWEWVAMLRLSHRIQQGMYLCVMAMIFLFGVWCIDHASLFNLFFLIASVVWWFFAAVLVVRYPKEYSWQHNVFVQLGMGMIVIAPTWIAINMLRSHSHGIAWVFFLLFLISIADIAAYFVGRQFGTTKLMPNVSPGKTWAGLVGAVFFTMIVSFFASFLLPVTNIIAFLISCLGAVLLSVLGDLFESLYKRQHGCKDSGTILPGHGGLLDRIDSLTAAAPWFVLGVFWFQ